VTLTRLPNYCRVAICSTTSLGVSGMSFYGGFLDLHVPALSMFALWLMHNPRITVFGLIPLVACYARYLDIAPAAGVLLCLRGLVYCSAALVVFAELDRSPFSLFRYHA
jgi:hypothetical protein